MDFFENMCRHQRPRIIIEYLKKEENKNFVPSIQSLLNVYKNSMLWPEANMVYDQFMENNFCPDLSCLLPLR